MGKKLKYYLSILTISAIIFTGCGSSQDNQSELSAGSTGNQTETLAGDTDVQEESDTAAASQVVVDTEFTANDLEVGYEESTAVNITLGDGGINVSGDGADVKDNVVTITGEGTYVLSGSISNGQIVVDAGDSDKIHIILNGISVTCPENAPIYIKNADKVFITLNEGTENTLTDGSEYVQTDDNNVDGVIFSKADLTINGSGTLIITGNYKHGIASKDDLVITGGTYHITAAKDALNGKDCVKIKDGTFNLSAETGNGIQSKNGDDATKGYVYVAGGDITVSKSREGIEGTVILIEDGTIHITAEDDGFNAASGSSETTEDPVANTGTDIGNGERPAEMPDLRNREEPDTASDSTSGTDTTGTVTGGVSDGAKETADMPADDITGGIVSETAETDSQRPGRPEGGDFKGGFGGGFGGGGGFEADTNCYISITGGTVYINASGDGIDSNGALTVSGGNIYVSGPVNNGNGALDYNGTADITGGTVIAVGSSGMAQGFSDTSTQYSLLYNLTAVSDAGTEVKLTDEEGNVVASYTPDKEYQSVVISTPELKKDGIYTLTCGEQTAQITLSSVVTSNGQQGMGGGPGGGGRRREAGQASSDNP